MKRIVTLCILSLSFFTMKGVFAKEAASQSGRKERLKNMSEEEREIFRAKRKEKMKERMKGMGEEEREAIRAKRKEMMKERMESMSEEEREAFRTKRREKRKEMRSKENSSDAAEEE